MQKLAQHIVQHRFFERFIITIILASAVLIGMETSLDIMASYGHWIHLGNQFVLTIFIIEAALKIYAVAPKLSGYFGKGWNIFDFSIILLALLPSTGEFAMIARLARLLRVLRLISALPELRLIVATLMRSIPSMATSCY